MTTETTGNLNNDWVANKIEKLYLLKKNLTILTSVWHSIIYLLIPFSS